jgi:enterochelin esterase family protein
MDGEQVTFVWRGTSAPFLKGDFTDWEDGISLRQTGRDIWTRTLTFPRDAYLEYSFFLDGKRVLDPSNPRRTSNGIGDMNNYFYMPSATPTELNRKGKGVEQGRISTHRLKSNWLLKGRTRAVHLYHPPVRGPYPLLVVLDGAEYLHRAKLAVIVDNLIAQKRIRPLAMAFVENGHAARPLEYAQNDGHLFFLLSEVIPLARRELDLITRRGVHGILGASLGGLAAMYSALRAPVVFGNVLSQSGSFHIDRREFLINDLVRHLPFRPINIWMDVGRYEWLLESNRRLRRLLTSRGYDVTYHEQNAGHNYPAWRNDIWRGLEALFGR